MEDNRLKNKTILIVDDEEDILRLLSMRLEASGYDVVAAESGEQALVQVSLKRPAVVITDLRMEGMDGMALFNAIHKVNSALPVIILTAHGTIPDAIEATKQGVFSYLTKPFDSKQLLTQIEKALSISSNTHADDDYEDNPSEWRSEVISRSPVMEELLSQAALVAKGDASVFIHGESGTGKELLAKAIHKASSRRDHPFIAVNCAAIPEHLLESELFGHTKGAFTGAASSYEGLFQAAHKGSIFLDEIGDMPLTLQVKLLRVLQERQVRPVGSTKSVDVDVRIISATHCDIDKEMNLGNFREDLYYRLNVVNLELPRLTDRRQDIPLLANHFLEDLVKRQKKKVKAFAPEAMEMLMTAPWPGNIRQLKNVVEQSFALCTTPIIPARLVLKALRGKSGEIMPLTEAKRRFEHDYLLKLLQLTSGNVSQAARLANRNRTEFYKLLHRHHLNPAEFKLARSRTVQETEKTEPSQKPQVALV
ncbi:MAG: sigma 54-interacting transcriptional regulator [Gammaproteobacteria bacterium]|nr:sigma 54-interacting transcriptional regulator [Gammaproteobacteria bacterium]